VILRATCDTDGCPEFLCLATLLTEPSATGAKQPVGQVAMANCTNPGGLEKAGNSEYRVSANSGAAVLGTAAPAVTDPFRPTPWKCPTWTCPRSSPT
jgi:hypothetical protein